MKKILKFCLLLLVVTSLSSFIAKKPPVAQFVGIIVITTPNNAGLSGSYRVFSLDTDITQVYYITTLDYKKLIYTTGHYNPLDGWVGVYKDNEEVYSGYSSPY